MDYTQYYRYYTKLEPVMKRPEVKAYTTLTLSIFAAALAVLFAIRPGVERFTITYKKVQESNGKNQELSQKIKDLQTATATYDSEIAPKLQLLDNALPINPDFTSLLKNIERKVDEAGTPMLSVSFQQIDIIGKTETKKKTSAQFDPNASQQQSLGKQTPIEFNFAVTGSYDGIKSILSGLYKLNRIVVVESADIVRPDLKNEKPSESGTPQGEYNMSLKATAYYQR